MKKSPKTIKSIKGMKLASRLERLWAALIDGALISPLMLSSTYYRQGYNLPRYIDYMLAAYFICIVVVQAVMLSRSGQSIGKRLRNMKIVRLSDGKNGGFKTNVLKRYVILFVVSLIPIIGTTIFIIFDPIIIFGKYRRCLHDFIAGTHVVKIRK